MIFTKQRGTVDLYGDEARYFNQVESIIRYLAEQYNIEEIRTPIFEATQLYTKAVGDTSDIVHKEFYNFKDKGDREIALRPEGTAGTIRAIVEEKMLANIVTPLKVFYMGPMFRYERPQSGRQRQFHQFGIEVVGPITPSDEIETICLASAILETCGVTNYELEINNIGSAATRQKWAEALKEYFKDFKDQLTEDSLNRLEKNPLRILDDKVDGEKDFVKKAPKLEQFLSDDDKKYFDNIKDILNVLDIKYKVNPNLVRGLDYYNGLVYEFVSKSDKLKGQSTIIGGGRYSELVKLTGGPDVPGIGFGLGIERLIIAIKDENPDFLIKKETDIVYAPLTAKALHCTYVLINLSRSLGLSSACNYAATKIDKHFKYAEKQNARYVIIIGDKELENKQLVIKDQTNKTEQIIKLDEFDQWLKGIKK